MIISNLDFQENIAESGTVLGSASASLDLLLDAMKEIDRRVVSQVQFDTNSSAVGLLTASVDLKNASVEAGLGFVNAQSTLTIISTTPNANN